MGSSWSACVPLSCRYTRSLAQSPGVWLSIVPADAVRGHRRAIVLTVLRSVRRVQLDQHADAILLAPLQRRVDIRVGALHEWCRLRLCITSARGWSPHQCLGRGERGRPHHVCPKSVSAFPACSQLKRCCVSGHAACAAIPCTGLQRRPQQHGAIIDTKPMDGRFERRRAERT